MELEKHDEKPLEFKWKDVTFKIKPRATAADRLAVAFRDQKTVASYSLTLIERMVIDWEGVTLNGQPVPYSFELLSKHLPSTAEDNALIGLAGFIWENTDIGSGLDKDLKKKSSKP